MQSMGREVREVLVTLVSKTRPRTGPDWQFRISVQDVGREPFPREIREVTRNGGKIMVLSVLQWEKETKVTKWGKPQTQFFFNK